MEDFHESLQLEEYIALCRQDIAIDITIAEMACLHSLLLKYKEDIVSPRPCILLLLLLTTFTEHRGALTTFT